MCEKKNPHNLNLSGETINNLTYLYEVDGLLDNFEYGTPNSDDSSSALHSFSIIFVIFSAKLVFPTFIVYFKAKFKDCSDRISLQSSNALIS